MNDLVKAEFRKLRTTRTAPALLAATVAVSILGGQALAQSIAPDTYLAFDRNPFLAVVLTISGLVTFVLGARSLTDEYRFGTITPSLLVVPSRARLVGAKAIVLTGAGALFGIVSGGLIAAATATLGGGRDVTAPAGRVAVFVAGTAVAGALWALGGLALGALVRQQLAVVAGGGLWFLFGEPVVSGAIGESARFLPGSLLQRTAGASGGADLPVLVAGLLAAALVAATAAAGVRAMRVAEPG